jgi:subtilisin family serine protease
MWEEHALIALWTWLCQVIDKDKSCKNAVSRLTSYLAASLFFLVLCWLASTAVGENPSSFFETKKLEQKSFVDLHKLDPVLKRFVLDQEVMAAPGVLTLSAPPMMRLRDPGTISAIIKVSGNAMAIESSGARVRTVIGEFATADVPFGALNRLIQLPNVIYVQASRLMEPTLLDVSVPGTGAHQVWKSTPGYTGKGVIVGVIDSGIDWSHPDFKGKDGSSRILYIWDQGGDPGTRGPGDVGMSYGYGVEWTKADIDSGLCEEMDPSGHGTHVTSTIAGDGGDMHGFTGMAPDADIIVVKTSFGDAEILDGVDYILRKASELDRPVVVNMSFGSQWGPHDGTSLLDQAVDRLLGESGEAIVAAAGNEGGRTVHVGAVLRQPVGGNYPWTAVHTFIGAESTVIQIWYDSPDPLSVRVLLPENDRGDLADLGIGWVSEGQLRIFSVPSGPIAGAEVAIEAQQIALYPNRKGVYIHISNNGDLTIPIDEYIYAVEYDGSGITIDAYVVWRGYFERASRLPASVLFPNKSFLLEGDGYNTIISPASASEVICVGSYVSRSEWVDWENSIRDENLRIDSISAFSSFGPLLNGARKPDIAAPGEMVVAAFSTDSWDRPNRIYRDGRHVSMRGTSMAAPHVTGAVALMYEQNPNLTASEVKYILTRSATDRGPVGWDKAWGYGALNVLAAMNIPSEPRVLRAAAGDGSITVEWYPSKETDIAGYRIYARLDAGYWMLDTGYWLPDAGDWTPDAGCWRLDAGSWIPDTGCWMLESSIKHRASSIQYQVSSIDQPVSMSISAYNGAGNEGPRSQEITIIPGTPGPDVTPPDPPGDLTAVSIDSAVDLTWSRNREHDLSGYKIHYGTSTGNYSQVQRVGKVSNYRLKGLTNGVRVYVSVSAVDTSGNESGRASEVSAVPRLFTRTSLRYQSGWPVLMRHDVYSSPTLYDADGDGRLEVSVSAKDGRIHLLRHDGSSMRGWPISTGLASISSPALADVDGDGSVEVVVGAGDRVYMWSDRGTPVQGWPVSTLGNVTASPALGDIDDDGRMEVIVGSRDGILYAYNNDGSTVNGWPVIVRGYIHSSAALADMDGDSRTEIVVGSGDGYLYVFKGDGTTTDGWPVYVRSEIVSSPAVGDIDGDGSMEIVIADKSGWVHAWHYSGRSVEGWPVNLRDDIVSSPALGDIDDNKNTLEIVIGTKYGSIYVLKSDGTTMDGWPVSVADDMTSSPAIGDIDGDGNPDVIVATGTGLGYTGLVYAFRGSGKKLGTLWPVHTQGNISYSSPALGDLDGDGDVEVVVGSCRNDVGSGGYLHAWDISGRPGDAGIVWGGFRHDSRHTGVADDTIPPSFVIAVLQNPALKKHLNLYAISSEKLIADPELTVEVTSSGANEKNFVQSTILTQLDVSSNIYYTSLTLAEQDGMYNFTVSGTDASGNTGTSSKNVSILPVPPSPRPPVPPSFSLLPNYPNPFNPGTWIPYELAQTSDVTIEIYSSACQLIRSLALGRRTAGSYTVAEDAAYWDGTDNCAQEVASGVYFYVLRAGSFEACRKMILLR